MKTISIMIAGIWGGVLSFSGTAEALPQSIHRIPHGTVFGCETCHPGGAVDQLNNFGELTQGIRHAYVFPEDWWTIMYDVDSDGDGLTNGEELGDPCGRWAIGQEMPRVAEVSNPGSENSWIELPVEPSCPPVPVAGDPASVRGMPSPSDDAAQGACSFRPGQDDAPAGGALMGAALVLSALLASPRRGRRARLQAARRSNALT